MGFLFVCLAGRNRLKMKVLNWCNRWSSYTDVKGVHCKVESEGSRRQSAGPTHRNRVRQPRLVYESYARSMRGQSGYTLPVRFFVFIWIKSLPIG